MPKLAIIHTTPVTVEPLKALAAELLPGVKVVNFVDDSVLPQLAENGGDVSAVEPRLVQYGKFAEEVGADIILSACSSVGAVAVAVQRAVHIPVVRIDEAMAEAAVRCGSSIGVAATLETTLAPPLALLKAIAKEAGERVRLEPRCISAAYERLLQGDREGHDKILTEALTDLANEVDVVVLAQASMARVLDSLPETLQDKFLTSPRLGVTRVRDVLAEAGQ
ncbi:aspartate/glutamate racemase family protein [soil metagenome]